MNHGVLGENEASHRFRKVCHKHLFYVNLYRECFLFSTDKGNEVFVFLFVSGREKKKKSKIQDSPDTQILKSYMFVGNALSGNKRWKWHAKHPSPWGDEDTSCKGEISHWRSLAVVGFLRIKQTEIVTENGFGLDSTASSMISKRLSQLKSLNEIFF